MSKTVVMKSLKGAWQVSYDLPNGKRQYIEFKDNGSGDFIAEVPTQIVWEDVFSRKDRYKVFHDNYAQFLLDAYNRDPKTGYEKDDPLLEVVEIKEKEVVIAPVVQPPPPRPVKKQKEVTQDVPKKEKKNEKSVSVPPTA